MSVALLYRQPQVLDRTQHRGKRLKPRTTGIAGAKLLNAVFVGAGEFGEVAKEYVIGFVAAGDEGSGEVTPVAVLGLRERENLFATDDGRWDARYVPAFIRRYPFIYGHTGDGPPGVMIDTAWEGFNDTEGELLVQDDGEAAPYLQEMMKFLNAFEDEVQRTRALCTRLVELQLLKPVQIDVDLPDGKTLNAGGLQMIDEEKLKALPEAAMMELLRNGALGLLYAQLMSSSNVQRLTEKLGQRMAAEAAKPAA